MRALKWKPLSTIVVLLIHVIHIDYFMKSVRTVFTHELDKSVSEIGRVSAANERLEKRKPE